MQGWRLAVEFLLLRRQRRRHASHQVLPEYGDSQHHGGFDPNVIFPSCGLDLNHPVDLNSSAMRRDPAVQTAAGRSLSFDAGASHVIDGMTPDAPELMQV